MSEPIQSWLKGAEAPVSNAASRALSFEHGPLNTVTSAPHRYVVEGFNAGTNPEYADGESQNECVILFQNGVVPEVGVNGVTNEIIVDILIHRLEGFQSGKFACPENERALEGLRAAKQAFLDRTQGRQQRQVEGTHEA